MLRLAHRGDWRRAPENTLAALVAACSLPGIDGVEFDVRVSSDGVAVLAHDADLRRVHGAAVRVRDTAAAELEVYAVPSLAAVLSALPADAFLDVELKEQITPAIVDVLFAARGERSDGAVLSSFSASILRRGAALAPDWPRWLNTFSIDPTVVRSARELGCVGVAAEWRAVDERSAGLAQRHGLEVVAWPVTRRATLRRLERLGVYGAVVEGAALGS